MRVKAGKTTNDILPFGKTGAVSHTFTERFRTFSIYNNTGSCIVTPINGSPMTIPVGVTVNWDAATEDKFVNRFKTRSFKVVAADCVIVGTL